MREFSKNQKRPRETNLVQFSTSNIFCNLLAASEPEFPCELHLDSQDIFEDQERPSGRWMTAPQ
jgi:hypothetical protein